MFSKPRHLGLIVAAAIAVIALGGVCSASTPAEHSKVANVLEGLQRYYHETNSFRAKFVEVLIPVGAPQRTRTGTVYFRKPGRMRWDFEEPNKEIVVSDGSQIYDYDPELNQVVEAPLSNALHSPGATEFLLGVGDISRDFNAAMVDSPASDGLMHVKLSPKLPGNTVELGLEEKSYDIQTIRVTDQLGNVTSLKFLDVEKNVPIADATFTFSPPAGADIVRSSAPK